MEMVMRTEGRRLEVEQVNLEAQVVGGRGHRPQDGSHTLEELLLLPRGEVHQGVGHQNVS